MDLNDEKFRVLLYIALHLDNGKAIIDLDDLSVKTSIPMDRVKTILEQLKNDELIDYRFVVGETALLLGTIISRIDELTLLSTKDPIGDAYRNMKLLYKMMFKFIENLNTILSVDGHSIIDEKAFLNENDPVFKQIVTLNSLFNIHRDRIIADLSSSETFEYSLSDLLDYVRSNREINDRNRKIFINLLTTHQRLIYFASPYFFPIVRKLEAPEVGKALKALGFIDISHIYVMDISMKNAIFQSLFHQLFRRMNRAYKIVKLEKLKEKLIILKSIVSFDENLASQLIDRIDTIQGGDIR